MSSPVNPFDSIVANLQKIHKATQRKSITERTEDVEMIKYSGSYEDYYGEPIRLEVLYSEDEQDGVGNATFTYGERTTKVKFQSSGGGVLRHKIIEGNAESLLELLLALASNRQEM